MRPVRPLRQRVPALGPVLLFGTAVGADTWRVDEEQSRLPVPVPFTLTHDDESAYAEGTAIVVRKLFGVGRNAEPGLASPEVLVRFAIRAERAAE